MSIETANSTLPQPASSEDPDVAGLVVQEQIDRARFHVRLVEIATAATQLIAGVLAFLLIVTLIDHWVVGLSLTGRLVAFVLLLVGSAAMTIRRVVPCLTRPINPVYAARAIEQAAPSLKNSLINFLLLRSRRDSLRPVIFAGVERQAAADLASVDIDAAVDRSPLIHVGYLLAALVLVLGVYKIASPKDPFQSVARVITPWKPIPRPSRVQIRQLRPGSTEVYRGTTLEVSALVDGLDEDETVILRYSTEDGQAIDRELPLRQSEDSPRYRVALTTGDLGIQESLTYHLQAGDSRTEDYRVLLKDAPTIHLKTIEYDYPSYTQWSKEVITGRGDLKALEGTRVRIEAVANQPIRTAYLELFQADDLAARDDLPKPSKALAMKSEDQRAWGQLTLGLLPDRTTPQYVAYQIRFQNQEGQRNLEPARFQIEVTPDLPPLVEIVAPRRRDLELPENRPLMIEVRALDPDFALQNVTLQAHLRDREVLHEVMLERAHSGPLLARYELVPRRIGLAAGDVVLYRAIAEDNRTGAPSGTPDPNRQQTDDFRIRIVAADAPDDEATPSQDPDSRPTPSETDSPDSENGEAGEASDAGQTGEQGGAGEASDSEGGGEAGGAGEQSEAGPAGEDQQSRAEGGLADAPAQPDQGESESTDPAESTDGQTGDSRGDQQSQPGAEPSAANGPSEGEADGAQPNEPVASDGSNDGDAFERILEHLRDQRPEDSQQTPGESSREQSSDNTGDNTGDPAESPSEGRPGQTDADPSATPGDDRSDPAQPTSSGDSAAQPQEPGAQDAAEPASAGTDAEGDPRPSPNGEAETSDRRQPGGTDSRPDAADGAGDPTGDAESARDASPAQPGGESETSTPPGDAAAERPEEASDRSTAPDERDGSSEPGSPQPGDAERAQRPREGGPADGASDGGETPAAGTSTPEGGVRQEAGSADSSSPPAAGSEGTPAERPTLPGGQPATGEASGSAPESPDPPGDEPNLEFAEEATDLALEHLRQQQENTELLERLGWTPEQAEAFLRRWEQMRRAARQPDARGQQSRRQMEDQLRGLGLRPQAADVRRDVTTADLTRGMLENGGQTAPPPEYRDQYRAFLRGFSRADAEP